MWILNVKFNSSTWNFLSSVILSAIFNVSVLGFSVYFCLKTIKTFYFILFYFIYFIVFPGITTSGKSLMKSIKNNGPNKELWCKPEGMTDH